MTDETPTPLDTVASWGRTGEIPRLPEAQRPWVDAGPPPSPGRRRKASSRMVPLVAVMSAVAALSLVVILSVLITATPRDADGGPAFTGPSTGVSAQVSAEPKRAGTLDSPYKPGQSFTIPGWTLSLSATVSGKKAETAVRRANQFNDPPGKGETFVLTTVTVRHDNGESAAPWVSFLVRFLPTDGVVRDGSESYCGAISKPLTDVGEMFAGSRATGNVCVRVPSNRVAGGRWVIDPVFDLGDSNRVYVSVK